MHLKYAEVLAIVLQEKYETWRQYLGIMKGSHL